MGAGSLVLILESTSALLVLSLLVFRLIPSYRLDKFRQDVFRLRDEVFDYALAGNISFSHPAYKLLRQSSNGFIRYAHRLTLFRVVTTMLIWKVVGHKPELVWTKRWSNALQSLDEKTRAQMLKFHERLAMLVIDRLVFGSPILVGALLLTALVVLCQAGITSLRAAFRKSARDTVERVIDPRLLEEEAADTPSHVAVPA